MKQNNYYKLAKVFLMHKAIKYLYYSIGNTLCIILFFSLLIPKSNAYQIEVRDLSKYDKAGPYGIGFPEQIKSKTGFIDDDLAEMRQFLWEHYTNKQLGMLQATFVTIEGNKTDSKFFVEPNDEGEWCIIEESEYTYYKRQDQSFHKQSNKEIYNIIKRVIKNKKFLATDKFIPKNKIIDSHKYYLLLKNKSTGEKSYK